MDNKEVKDIALETNKANKSEIYLFSENPDLWGFFKRTQKICYAVYMVSDLLDRSEPLRYSLREKTNFLLSFSISLSNKEKDKNKIITQCVSSLHEVLSLIEAGHFGRTISEMNFNILKNYILELTESFESHAQIYSPKVLSKDFLEFKSELADKGQTIMSFISPLSNDKKTPLSKSLPSDDKESRSVRADKIVALLKDNKELSIKDFLRHIKGCSEKTIQRELLSLVSKGSIKKKGERRWSRYSL